MKKNRSSIQLTNNKHNLKQLSDEDLMEIVSQGNLDAMTYIFERYHIRLYNFYFQKIRDASVCEDLTQNVFLKIIKYKHSYKGGKFASWIFKIARNLFYDYYQEQKKTQPFEDIDNVAGELEEGNAVLAYDIRLHGKSGKDGEFGDLYNNPKRAPLDLDAALNFIIKTEDHINFKRVGIIGASIGANLAAAFASKKYTIDDFKYRINAVVVLSAKTSAAQNLSGQTKPIIPNNAFYIASKDEQSGKRALWAKELFDKTTGKRKIVIPSGKKHGSYILREHPKLQDEIVKWLHKTL